MLLTVVGVLGLLVGSFLNVVIWRVPRGESVVTPPSACPRCGTRILARDNVPVLGWLVLRGRCRTCREPISARYPLVELATGLLFAGTALWTGLSWTLPAYLYLAAVSVALALIDLDTRRLPNAIVLPSYGVVAVLLAVAAWGHGDPAPFGRAALGGAALYGFYFLLMVAHSRGMGFGDVKLAGVLGLYLGWVGWDALVVGAFTAFLLGGIAGAVLMATGRATRKTGVPFGPFMLLGAAIGLTLGPRIADAYVSLLV